MSTATPKRPPAGSRDSPNASPSRQPRASTPSSGERTGTGTATPGSGVARTRSVRSSTLVSARAAAQQRRESLLSNSTSASGSVGTSPTGNAAANTEAEEAARAETLAALDDLKERLSKAEGASEQYQRQNDVLQARLDEAIKEHSKLEERAHEYDEQTETLKNEKREMARQIQQMETIYEAERSAMTREKEDMSNREEEMQRVIQRLKDSLAQRNTDDEGRPSRISSNNSPGVDSGSFAPPSSLHRSDSRNNSKLLLQKDKLIESLRLELAEAQIKLVESENQGGGRLHEVERQLMEARMANARLMEDNESYQLLLQEKTLKGDFGTADFGFGGGLGLINSTGDTHSRPRSSNEDALNALEGRAPGGNSLADELNDAAGSDSDEAGATNNAGSQENAPVEGQRRLEAELKSLQDQNKALTLYINKIIERLLEHQDYQYILDKSTDGKQPPPPTGAVSANTDKELPPPPPEKPQQPSAIQSFLQRTKSITVRSTEPAAGAGAPAAAKRPRPVSYMPEAVMTNPDTAPSIPISLNRTTSMRRPMRPMSEQFTGAGSSGTSAASVVNAMYKGGGTDGPLSPGLRSSQFFGSGTYTTSGGANSASGSGARSPNIGGPGSNGASGNFPGMRSETSSVSGDSTTGERASGGTGSDTSPPQSSSNTQNSPPRPVHEKTAFTGSKPRPLRLVQENTESMTPTTNKRASWMGWWGKKDDASAASGNAATPTLTSMPASAEPIQE
ncbi:hypothetical protein SEUCBS139899_010086 [Sporothrix eucalyptigena]|uniref:M serotype protein n=1 Tax=Sporothrix eucalyptigena TaxID=1812306 RepID=A0ABP0D251_9PEZI